MTPQVLHWQELSATQRRQALERASIERNTEVMARVRTIIEQVRSDGDRAVREFGRQFDAVELERFAVSELEFTQARAALNSEQLSAIDTAIENVQRFHVAQKPLEVMRVETSPGIQCEWQVRPLQRVGLYVPAGSAPLPSAVIMLAVPARIAGCTQRILCTPPQADSRAHAAVLVAAQRCGIKHVFKIGGAHAIAALAYGTESVPKVDKIFGPGNRWVTAAKQLVAQDVAGAAFDLPAGPSEVMVIADEHADAAAVASDLLAQAEHDPCSQALLVTPSVTLAMAVSAQVNRQTAQLPRQAILAQSLVWCRCLVVKDIETAIDIANDYAPEHLIIQTREPRCHLDAIHNAGAVFLGAWSPESLGDYCAGPNHVLPTYGHARTYSGLSVLDFMKRITVQEVSKKGLQQLGPIAITLAQLEGLEAHAQAVRCRLQALANE
jgi:histidinol dehydrogenase